MEQHCPDTCAIFKGTPQEVAENRKLFREGGYYVFRCVWVCGGAGAMLHSFMGTTALHPLNTPTPKPTTTHTQRPRHAPPHAGPQLGALVPPLRQRRPAQEHAGRAHGLGVAPAQGGAIGGGEGGWVWLGGWVVGVIGWSVRLACCTPTRTRAYTEITFPLSSIDQ